MEKVRKTKIIPCADDTPFMEIMKGESDFDVRRAVERLREGLFDPVAVRLLTAHEERLKAEAERGSRSVHDGGSAHLCLVGSYGQGKSHSLVYMEDLALREGFAVSLVNLDPREVPFHFFREVYRELMAHLTLPDTDAPFPVVWTDWLREQIADGADSAEAVLGLLPETMPYLFKSVLAAMARGGNVSLTGRERRMKKQAAFRPREIPQLLARALSGEAVPIPRLRNALKYREIPLARGTALSCRGQEAFLGVAESFSCLLRSMGYRGWVLLFDEGEAITQTRSTLARSRSYRLLHRMFGLADSGPSCIYPVFAFTDDFLRKVREEDYELMMFRGEDEIPFFERDYAREWKHLNIYRLLDLSTGEWEDLSRKLLCLHARAYGWSPPEERLIGEMKKRLDSLGTQETRLKLKALVDCLDLAHQEQVL